MTAHPHIYFAFGSGNIDYACKPCGACCRGVGLVDDPEHLLQLPHRAELAPFRDTKTPAPLIGYFTFTDGCRFLGLDDLCDLHRQHGPKAKPYICQLFPFAKLVDVDGLRILLPHSKCPWTGSLTQGAATASHHGPLLEALLAPGEAFFQSLCPEQIVPVTDMDPLELLQLEVSIRDGINIDSCDGYGHTTLNAMLNIQRSTLPSSVGPPRDQNLWLDLLRSAGNPNPWNETLERTFIAALPAMRIMLSPHLPMQLIPVALWAFGLWLRCLQELGPHELTGQDLLRLLEHAIPLLRVMACAQDDIPVFEKPLTPQVDQIIHALQTMDGPLGYALLRILQPYERGTLPILMQLGASMQF